MAKARAIVKRRKAVQNIKKITQTMQLIATARFQKCLQRATATKPYTQQISEMVQTVVATDAVRKMLKAAEQDESGGGAGSAGTGPTTGGGDAAASAAGTAVGDGAQSKGAEVVKLLQPNKGVSKSILLVITSNRGLCGGYNANVLKNAMEHRRKLASEGVTPALEMVGKKGVNYFRFLNEPIADKITDVEDKIEYARVAAMAERHIRLYQDRQISRVDVAYMRFQSVGIQRPTVAKLLPIDPPEGKEGGTISTDIEFSPAPELLLARLIPETIKIRLLQYFNDAIVSEQVARMVAMKAATDAAGDMIKFLTRQYNRSRQSQITMELLDIIGGAEAIK